MEMGLLLILPFSEHWEVVALEMEAAKTESLQICARASSPGLRIFLYLWVSFEERCSV